MSPLCALVCASSSTNLRHTDETSSTVLVTFASGCRWGGRLSRIAKLGWESYRVVGQVGRPSWSSLNRPDGDWPHETRSSPTALLGERWDRERGTEGRTARLISSCPSYGAGRVNELASRQGPVDPLSCRCRERTRRQIANVRFAKRRRSETE